MSRVTGELLIQSENNCSSASLFFFPPINFRVKPCDCNLIAIARTIYRWIDIAYLKLIGELVRTYARDARNARSGISILKRIDMKTPAEPFYLLRSEIKFNIAPELRQCRTVRAALAVHLSACFLALRLIAKFKAKRNEILRALDRPRAQVLQPAI
jgi:hypothetical protein